ncbi:MAG TPA: hypothetical protein VHS09_17875 [Polyangiaceae bacterium]|nr:hypothetical protein [Polyangiaceae bacterium]
MNVFGPFYPPALQAVVNHAERLSELLGIHELAPPTHEWAHAWMTGRADEVARFVEHVVGQWREGRLPDAEAAATLDGYLVALHEGLSRHLHCADPPCCAADEATTARPARRGGHRVRVPPAGNEDPTALGTLDSLWLEEALRPSRREE